MSGDADAFDSEAFLKTLTGRPGVYRMLDAKGQVIYVGKARNLKKRVSSYFRAASGLEAKTQALMRNTANMEVTATHTETEALLLENNLIKEHRPRYNIVLRDDKSFPYIYLSTQHAFPRLSFHRGARSGKGRYYGPYASAGATRETLNQLILESETELKKHRAQLDQKVDPANKMGREFRTVTRTRMRAGPSTAAEEMRSRRLRSLDPGSAWLRSISE